MGSLPIIDFDALDRDAEQLRRDITACVGAIEKYSGNDVSLYHKLLGTLESGEFDSNGELRQAAIKASILPTMETVMPMLQSFEFALRKRQDLSLKNFGEHPEHCRDLLLEYQLRKQLRNSFSQAKTKEGPLTFERLLHQEQQRRRCFLEACKDMVARENTGTAFNADELHIGAGLAHNRVLTNRTIFMPYFSRHIDGEVRDNIDPWHLNILEDRIAGYKAGFGFASATINSATKTYQADGRKRDCWFPVVCLDREVYKPLVQLSASSQADGMAVEKVLGCIRKFFMLSGHDYLHHAIYTYLPPKEKQGIWNEFERANSPYRLADSPKALTDQRAHINQLSANFLSTRGEFFSFVMHRRILRHLFNSEKIDDKDNTRGRHIKESLIKSGEKLALDLEALRQRLAALENVGSEKARQMTEYLATLGLSQLALMIDMDDPDMKRVYAAFDRQQIFTPYSLPPLTLRDQLAYASGSYKAIPNDTVTRAFIESISPDLQHRYVVESLKQWSQDLSPDQSLENKSLTGEEGVKARILMGPWGGPCGWLNEKELGKDWCPRIAQSYYDAFMDPALLESPAFQTARDGFTAAVSNRHGDGRSPRN